MLPYWSSVARLLYVKRHHAVRNEASVKIQLSPLCLSLHVSPAFALILRTNSSVDRGRQGLHGSEKSNSSVVVVVVVVVVVIVVVVAAAAAVVVVVAVAVVDVVVAAFAHHWQCTIFPLFVESHCQKKRVNQAKIYIPRHFGPLRTT